MRYLLLSLVILSALSAAVAEAQVVVDQAATAGESYSRGVSGIISAQGQKNLSDSQAAINATEARSNQIDNSIKSVNAYWEKKGIYAEHEQAENEVIEQRRNEYMAKHGLGTLTSEEFDRTSGKITWPKVLEQAQYDQYRKPLDDLFQKRSYNGALTSDEYMQATAAFNGWHTMLVGQKGTYPAPILDQMLRFIVKLKREMDDNLS